MAEPKTAPLRAEIMKAVDRFESDLGFTAPELTQMRIDELRSRVSSIFEDWEADPDA